MRRSSDSRWPHRLAVILVCATFPLLFIGGLVTSMGAGLAVPDWPTTFGYHMFLYPWSKMVGGIFYEHSHRLVASFVGLLTIALAATFWLREKRAWLRWLGLATLALVIAQGVMGGLRVIWLQNTLAIVHAAGSHDETRSHFDAQDYMESATPGVKSTRDGWLNRYLQSKQEKDQSSFRAVSITKNMPRVLQGRAPAVALSNLSDFAIRAGKSSENIQGGFEAVYAAKSSDMLAAKGRETFEAVNYLKKANPAQYKPENGAEYLRNPFGNSLLQIAQLIKSDVGLEVAFADVGGWDTHAAQGGAQGQLANNLRNFSEAIAAFAKDLGSRMSDVVLVTMSEFGRTVRENGNRGTDHGHATVMLALGGNVNGGKVYGKWPGLASGQLFEGRDLAVTTDFRDVFGEVLAEHLGVSSLASVFPRYQTKALGLL